MVIGELETKKIIDLVRYGVSIWATVLVITIAGAIISIYFCLTGETDSAISWFKMRNHITVIALTIATVFMFWKLKEINKLMLKNKE